MDNRSRQACPQRHPGALSPIHHDLPGKAGRRRTSTLRWTRPYPRCWRARRGELSRVDRCSRIGRADGAGQDRFRRGSRGVYPSDRDKECTWATPGRPTESTLAFCNLGKTCANAGAVIWGSNEFNAGRFERLLNLHQRRYSAWRYAVTLFQTDQSPEAYP